MVMDEIKAQVKNILITHIDTLVNMLVDNWPGDESPDIVVKSIHAISDAMLSREQEIMKQALAPANIEKLKEKINERQQQR